MGRPPLLQRWHCLLREAASDWVGTQDEVLVWVWFTDGAFPDFAFSI